MPGLPASFRVRSASRPLEAVGCSIVIGRASTLAPCMLLSDMPLAALRLPGFDFVWIFPIAMPDEPVEILDGEQDATVPVDLLEVLGLVTQQALVVLVPRQDANDVPERRPPQEAEPSHIAPDE